MAKAIAPAVANEGMKILLKIVDAGHNPDECTVGGKPLPNAYGKILTRWAEAFVDELEGNV